MTMQEIGVVEVSEETITPPDDLDVFKAALSRTFFPMDNFDRLRAMLNSLTPMAVPKQSAAEKVKLSDVEDDAMSEHVRSLP